MFAPADSAPCLKLQKRPPHLEQCCRVPPCGGSLCQDHHVVSAQGPRLRFPRCGWCGVFGWCAAELNMPSDAAEARAVLTHRGISVSGNFGFSGDGLVSRCAAGTATYALGPVMAGLPMPPNWFIALLQLPQRRLREGTGQWRHRADTVGGALPRIQAIGVSVLRRGECVNVRLLGLPHQLPL